MEGLAFTRHAIIVVLLGRASAAQVETSGTHDGPQARRARPRRIRRASHGVTHRAGFPERLGNYNVGDATPRLQVETERRVFTDARLNTDSALCPKCGQGLHWLEDLEECPWWRYASRWGDEARAVAAIPEITRRSAASWPGQVGGIRSRGVIDSTEPLVRHDRSSS